MLDYKKRNDWKISPSSTKLIARDSDIDEALHKSIMTKIKNYACKDCIVLDTIVKRSIKNSECYYKVKNSTENGDNK